VLFVGLFEKGDDKNMLNTEKIFFINKIDNIVRFCIPLLFTIIKRCGAYCLLLVHKNWDVKGGIHDASGMAV